MTVKGIDKFWKELENTEVVDDKTEYYKYQAIQYLKLYCDEIEYRGKKIIKQKGDTDGQPHNSRRFNPRS